MIKHPAKRFIQYLYITGTKNNVIVDSLLKQFKITITEKDVKELCSGLKSFVMEKQNQRLVVLYMQRNGLSIFTTKASIDKVRKVISNKKLLYFINTAIFRGIDFSVIKDILNTPFSDFESSALFTEEHIETYRNAAFDLRVFEEQSEIEEFWKNNKTLFDFKSDKKIETLALEAGLMPSVDHVTVMKNVQTVMYVKFMEKINSPNEDEQKASLEFGKAAANVAGRIASLKVAEKSNETFNRIMLDFSGGEKDDGIINMEELK